MALLERIVDVTDPNASDLTGQTALIRGAGNGAANSAALQAIIDAAHTDSPATALSIYFPPGLFALSSTITLPNNRDSIRFTGGGGMAKGLSQINAHLGSCTYLVWEGGATGPMFHVQNTDGDIWEYLNFDGVVGPDTNASGPGDGLDVLIKYLRSGGGSGCFFHTFRNCTFANAQRLVWAANDAGSIGTAEFRFDICLFNCGETSAHRWNSQAFYADNPQSVNNVFTECEWNNCGYAVSVKDTGRVMIENATVAIVGTVLKRDGGTQNVAGDKITFPHFDGGTGSEGRKQMYQSVEPNSSMGHVVIETPKYGSVGMLSDEFSVISGFTGSSLSLTSPIRMRVGDTVQFLAKADIDANEVHGVGKKETTIATRTSDTVYTTTATVDDLGITDIADWYVCNGEGLIECVSSDFIHLRNAWLTGQHMWGGRLARLSHSAFSTGRSPKLVAENLMATSWGVNFDQTGLATLLTITGTAYWRMENVDAIADSFGAPVTVGNFGLFGDPLTDIDFERVPIERTFVLFPSEDEGLVAESVKSFALSSDPLIAVEFVHDMPTGGYIETVSTPIIESGSTSGLTFTTGRDKSQAKLRVTTVATGLYVISQTVTYDDGSTATGRFSIEVVE